MKAEVIYKPGEMNVKTSITNGHADFTADESSDGENLPADEYLKRLGPGYIATTWDDALSRIHKLQDEKYIRPWQEIPYEEWDKALNVLPPEKWCTVLGVNIFRMIEYLTSNITAHYARINGRHYKAYRRTSTTYEEIAREIIVLQ